MPEKLAVKKRDKFRILHTEVLPYELPILFSNDRFYRFSKNELGKTAPELVKRILDEKHRFTVPFDYQIWQGNRNRRTLSLIHPAWQLRFIPLYREYSEVILSLCNRSGFSLRFPSRVASHFYDRDQAAQDDALTTGAVDEDPDVYEEQAVHASSYFFYAKHAQLFRFINSKEFLDLESRFPHLLTFDIKRCFASIYTHTISWAIKDKEFAKSTIGAFDFGSQFEKLMQGANFNETNGIVIGPEVSRIFAEIILQRIDLTIERRLQKEGVKDSDYAVRRYVDDYFVFTRDDRIGRRILTIAEEALQEYKLYVNEAKTKTTTVPFATPQTVAKTEVQSVLQNSLLAWLEYLRAICRTKDEAEWPGLKYEISLKTPYKVATRIIRDLKISIKRSGVTYDEVSGYALGSITRSLYRLQKAIDKGDFPISQIDKLQNILLIAVEVAFFIYAMDFRVRTTYFTSQLMLLVERAARVDPRIRELLISKMIEHSQHVLVGAPREKSIGVEMLNLLIAMKTLLPEKLLSPDQLFDLTNTGGLAKEKALKNYTYFDFVVLLFYAGRSSTHINFVKDLELEILARFSDASEIRQNAELCLLFFDSLSCPHVSIDAKRKIVATCFESILRRAPRAHQIDEIVAFCKRSIGFVSWSNRVELEKLLRRKELSPVY